MRRLWRKMDNQDEDEKKKSRKVQVEEKTRNEP